MTALGYVGLAAFALAWVPQSWETVRSGRCNVNLPFLLLSGAGSLALTLYAAARHDAVFSTLNALTTLGALLNAYFRLFPRFPSSRHPL